jgi:hypothetical protein
MWVLTSPDKYRKTCVAGIDFVCLAVMAENHQISLLEPPSSNTQLDNAEGYTTDLNVEGSSIKLDDLGPMVVNSDGVSVKHFQVQVGMIRYHWHRTFFAQSCVLMESLFLAARPYQGSLTGLK